jgi:hypothetical protein
MAASPLPPSPFLLGYHARRLSDNLINPLRRLPYLDMPAC